jgi:S1-C subfamily serine protease
MISGISSKGDIFAITALVSPGSSGSAVLNDKGKLLGIVTGGRTDAQNLNFAVPATLIQSVVNATNGTRRPSLRDASLIATTSVNPPVAATTPQPSKLTRTRAEDIVINYLRAVA